MRWRTFVAPMVGIAALALITVSCSESQEPTALAEHKVSGAARAVAVAEPQLVGGRNGVAHAVNNRGEVVGQHCGQDCFIRALYWTETGGVEDLGILPGYTRSAAYEITGNGTVFGILRCLEADPGCNSEYVETLVRWDRVGGTWTGTPLQGCARFNDDIPVNNNEQCVGRMPGSSQLAVQTLSGGAVVNSEPLPKLDPAGSEWASAISDAPMVAGHASADGQTVPAIWYRLGGTWAILPLGLPATYTVGSALDISEPDAAGRVYATGRAAGGGGRGYRAVLWTLDPDGQGGLRVTSTEVLAAPKGDRNVDSWGEAIHASGDAAGHSNIAPVFWPLGGGVQALPMPKGGGSGRAYDINNARLIVGYVFDRESRCDRAAIWRLQ